jgi:hypothetical protein
LIERIIENWLTNCNERQFQIPFCQLLTAEGETVVYVSPHGQREQGKDIVSIGIDRVPSAYQLKQGRITQSAWRQFKGEIDELVEYAIDLPGISTSRLHRAYLVTNGSVSDPVLSALKSANLSWKRRKYPPLSLINGKELTARFLKVHGSYLPSEPKNFKLFLELVLESGKSPLDKQKLAYFLESVLPIRSSSAQRGREMQRAIASAALLSSYILQSCENDKNWWALFEGWIVTGSHFLAVAAKYRLAKKWWARSFELCELSAVRALEQLCEECESNKTQLSAGDPLTDGHFYHYRITILLGTLSAWNLFLVLRKQPRPNQDFLRSFFNANLKNVRIWGESAVPLLLAAALQIEKFGDQIVAESLVVQLIDGITRANARGGTGVADPYFGPEESLRILYGLDTDNTVEFRGHSYLLQSLVDFLARRWRRNALARWWGRITRVQFTTFLPSTQWEWFTWTAHEGALQTRFPAERQSWSVLLSDAESRDVSRVPTALRENPAFALFFAIVYPHRFCPGLLRVLEEAIDKSAGVAAD